MSDNVTAVKSNEPVKVEGPVGSPYNFYVDEFSEGLLKGAKFVYKQLRNELTGDQVFEALGKSGEGNWVVTEMLNSFMKTKLATKVRNNLTLKNKATNEVDTEATALSISKAISKSVDNIIFTLEDAIVWNPGEREVSPETQLKKIAQAFKKSSKGEADLSKAKDAMAALLAKMARAN